MTETISTKSVPAQGWGLGGPARIDSKEGQTANAPGRQESELCRTTLGKVLQPHCGSCSHYTGASEKWLPGSWEGNGRGGGLGGRGREAGMNADFCQR